MTENNWIELQVSIPGADPEKREIATALLADIGFDSFSDTEEGITAYISSSLWSENGVRHSGLFDLPVLEGISISFKTIEKINWNREWEKNFHPVIIGGRLSVRAPFHPKPSGVEFDIIIEPKMSFGTGHHQTTALMAKLLLETDINGMDVMDMGCGTGLLAILACKKGASKVNAVDIDEWACTNSRENCIINNCNADIRNGDISLMKNEKYDLILANITRNILIENMNQLSDSLNGSGLLFLSGFYADDLPEIEKAAVSNGLIPGKVLSEDGWCAASFRRT